MNDPQGHIEQLNHWIFQREEMVQAILHALDIQSHSTKDELPKNPFEFLGVSPLLDKQRTWHHLYPLVWAMVYLMEHPKSFGEGHLNEQILTLKKKLEVTFDPYAPDISGKTPVHTLMESLMVVAPVQNLMGWKLHQPQMIFLAQTFMNECYAKGWKGDALDQHGQLAWQDWKEVGAFLPQDIRETFQPLIEGEQEWLRISDKAHLNYQKPDYHKPMLA